MNQGRPVLRPYASGPGRLLCRTTNVESRAFYIGDCLDFQGYPALRPEHGWSTPAATEGMLSRRFFGYLVDIVMIAILIAVLCVIIAVFGVLTFGLGWILFGLLPLTAIIYNAVTVGGPRQGNRRDAACVGSGSWMTYGRTCLRAYGPPCTPLLSRRGPFGRGARHLIFWSACARSDRRPRARPPQRGRPGPGLIRTP